MPRKKRNKLEFISIFLITFAIGLLFLTLQELRTFNNLEHYIGSTIDINTTIYFDNLTEQQILNVENTIAHIKPLYLENQNYVRITNNMSKYHPGANGINSGSGNITVSYFHCYAYQEECIEDEYYFRVTLCHELLHSFMHGVSEEEMVQDISQSLICYDDVTQNNMFKEKWKSTL